MRHFAHRPSAHLRPYVREVLWVSSDRERVQSLLRETTLTLVLRQSGDASISGGRKPMSFTQWAEKHAREFQ